MKEKFVSRAGFEPASHRNTSRKKNVINVKGELVNNTRAWNEKNLILCPTPVAHDLAIHLSHNSILAEDYVAIDCCPVFPALWLFWAN